MGVDAAESFKMSTMTAYLTLSVAAVAAVAAAVAAGPIMSDVRIVGASDEGKQSSLDRPSETKPSLYSAKLITRQYERNGI